MGDIICVSGGFDPLHGGHLSMFRAAAEKGQLVVILNSDEWLIRKKGFHFLPWEERAGIIRELGCVHDVSRVDDSDDTVCEALTRLKPRWFANGGDRKANNTPEFKVCAEHGIEMLWDIGGDKTNSSSEIARRAWVEREWGKYVTLDEGDGYKVKKLIINPGFGTSEQWHDHRTEYWHVVASNASIQLNGQAQTIASHGRPVVVESGMRHQINNDGSQPLVLIEVQTGSYLAEDDITRIA